MALLGAAVTGVMLMSASQASASGSLTTNVAVQTGAVVYTGEKPALCGRWCHHRRHGCGSWCGGGGHHHRCHHRCHRDHDDEGCRRGDNFGFDDGCRHGDDFGRGDDGFGSGDDCSGDDGCHRTDNCFGELCDSNDSGFADDGAFDGNRDGDRASGNRSDSTNQDENLCFGDGCGRNG